MLGGAVTRTKRNSYLEREERPWIWVGGKDDKDKDPGLSLTPLACLSVRLCVRVRVCVCVYNVGGMCVCGFS